MPKIMRYGGINVLDDAVIIRDVTPAFRVKVGPAAPPQVRDDDTEAGFEPVDFEPDEQGELPDALQGMDAEEPPAREQDAPQGTALTDNALTSEIIQGAMAEAGRIMEQALQSAEQAKDEALEKVSHEAEFIRQQAAEEGRRQGYTSVVETTQQVAKELENAIAQFEGQRTGFEVEYEEQLKWMAMEIAAKVLAKKVSEDDAVLTDMVAKAVQSVRGEAWVRVEVSQEMTRLIDALTQLYDDVTNVDVSAVPSETGTVHIETPSGVVDASPRTQLANLKEYFDVPTQ